MYQVTLILDGAEVGYGEGESLAYAKYEAYDSLEWIYREMIKQGSKITVQIIKS
jgi:hypothetical protein